MFQTPFGGAAPTKEQSFSSRTDPKTESWIYTMQVPPLFIPAPPSKKGWVHSDKVLTALA